MNTNELFDLLKSKFINGIVYSDAVNLCLAIFCSADWVSGLQEESCSKENIALSFSLLAKTGVISGYDPTSSQNQGTIYENFTEKNHWIQIMECALNFNKFYDTDRVKKLLG